MMSPAMFFDVGPSAGGIAVFAAVAFFFVLASVAFFAFKMLRKSVKMAFRLIIVAIILLIAVAGSVTFWWLGSSSPTRPDRPRPTQPR
jgi:uncharacterized membrane protein